MTKKLAIELTKMKDWEFFLLEHHIGVARLIRDTMTKNAIDESTMALRLGVDAKKMKLVINGSYPFDLRLLSRLQAYREEIAAANNKLKIEAEVIGFKEYKYSRPILVSRIESLIDVLEKQNNKQ